jgi:hypothetical protein
MKKTNELLTRQQFREGVFDRDHYKCVVCGKPAIDAHHLMERKLWTDGGYYLDNGASLCEKHHWDAELNKISPDELRSMAGITRVVLPPQLDPSFVYNKWGKVEG